MMGKVKNLFIQHKNLTSSEVLEFDLLKNIGLEEDRNSGALSPRQLLMVGFEVLENWSVKAGSFNENVVVSGIDFDQISSGSIINIGSAKLRVTYPNDKCNVVNKHIRDERGAFMIVTQTGKVRVGDEVIVLNEKGKSVPTGKLDKFKELVQLIPKGKVVSYTQIIKGIGGNKSHLRIIPSFIKKTQLSESNSFPVHRIVNSNYRLLEKYIPNQKVKLTKEGITLLNDHITEIKFHWNPIQSIY